jgi:predicted dithiol-disulfide oxidoreductase (DUF899 family)
MVFSWAWHSTPERQSLVTVSLKPDGDDQAACESHERGWDGSLAKLQTVSLPESPATEESAMKQHQVVSRQEWLAARRAHLAREKEFTRARDRLAAERRALPWVKVDKTYVFDGPRGTRTLGELFDGRSQLIVQHFMFAPDWSEGCKSCSFWADGFERMIPHLAARDTMLVAISRAPLPKLDAFKSRMGWTFEWFSSQGNDFNYDYVVSFTPEEVESGAKLYNFGTLGFGVQEAPGISVFYRNESGAVFHTYSCFARGLDMMNAAYHYLDLTPLGRQEEGLPYPMDWLRLRDSYELAGEKAASHD